MRHSAQPMHPAALPDDPLLALCEVLRSRGSGPGGRHRNSTESRIVVRHVATGTEVTAGERRSQHENLAVALGRMRLALAVEVRTAVNAAPSDLWRSRTRGGRISCNPEHRDFPLLLAEALDVVACAEFDVRGAAERLGVSATQLIRFIAACHPALALVNRERGSRAMSQLRG